MSHKKLLTTITLLVVLIAGLSLLAFQLTEQTTNIPSVSAAPGDYYVDINSIGGSCSDSNPGTITRPWCTISKANSALRAGDTVYIRDGTYNEEIKPARSGTEGNYITYTNYGSEEVIIDRKDAGNTVTLSGRSYINIDGLNLLNAVRLVEG